MPSHPDRPTTLASSVARIVRLRCPHCGGGHVLNRRAGVNQRCSLCNFKFERSEENYFMGAMFVNFMMSATLFVAILFAILAFAGPNIPWDLLGYVLPILTGVCIIALHPVSKVVWLAVDVMVRPVTPGELA